MLFRLLCLSAICLPRVLRPNRARYVYIVHRSVENLFGQCSTALANQLVGFLFNYSTCLELGNCHSRLFESSSTRCPFIAMTSFPVEGDVPASVGRCFCCWWPTLTPGRNVGTPSSAFRAINRLLPGTINQLINQSINQSPTSIG